MRCSLRIAFVFGSVLLAGCATGSERQVHAECVSVVDARRMLERGESSDSVCGFLRYGFEDKNLYDSKRAAGDQSASKCIAVGKSKGLSDDLGRFDGKWVLVSGLVVDRFCPEGVICPAACSNVGIFVDEVREKPR